MPRPKKTYFYLSGLRMNNILDEQRNCYESLSERAESWKTAHLEAMACQDIEDAIRIGLAIL